MRKLVTMTLLVIVLASLVFSGASAQSQPSSKVTASIRNITAIDGDATWHTIMHNTIKTASMKDLFVDASLECGLYTRTKASSKGGVTDTQTASAKVELQVIVDDFEVLPGPVVYCSRVQTLSATLNGLLNTCTLVNGVWDCSNADPESVELTLETMDANSFNFIVPDVTSGPHDVVVQAKITTSGGTLTDPSQAYATLGHGSVTIESVRMIRGEDVTPLD